MAKSPNQILQDVEDHAIKRLVGLYRTAVLSLSEDLVAGIDLNLQGRSRTFALIQNALQTLRELDRTTEAWALRHIPQVYRATQLGTSRQLAKFGLLRSDVKVSLASVVINRTAIEALVLDPASGFVGLLRRATKEVKDRIKTIQTQAKVLRQQQRVINETIARVGILEGANLNEVRDAIVDELVSAKKATDLVWRPGVRSAGPTSILANMADLPFVKIPLAAGGERHLRLDDYANLVARTKTRQAVTLARRAKLLEHDQPLVRVTLNKPLTDDACWLYIGKVFALTEAASREFGVPHVNQLPGGGTPFHPNCTHNEMGFFIEAAKGEVKRLGLQRPPAWALGRTWPQVEKEFRARGGLSLVKDVNKAGFRFGVETGGRQRRRAELEAAG